MDNLSAPPVTIFKISSSFLYKPVLVSAANEYAGSVTVPSAFSTTGEDPLTAKDGTEDASSINTRFPLTSIDIVHSLEPAGSTAFDIR